MVDAGEQNPKVQGSCTTINNYPINQGRDWAMSIIARAFEIACAADTSSMVQEMLDLMIEITQADSAHFLQADSVVDELVITHVRGDVERQYLVGLRLNRQHGLPGLSLNNNKIMVIDDLSSDPDWLHAIDLGNAARKNNVICLPILYKDRALGVIQIFNFCQADHDLLLNVGKQFALALEHRQSIVNIKRSNQRLLTLVDLLGEIAGTLDRNKLLHLVTEDAARLVNAERSSLFLVDPTTSQMVYQVAYQPPREEDTPPTYEPADGSSRFPKAHPPTRSNSSRSTNPSHFEMGDLSYFNRSAITVPIRSGPHAKDSCKESNQVLGGLMVLNNPRASFQEDDAQLIQILANQASTFLQVVDIYETTEELFLGVIKSLIIAIEAKDPYTQGHSQRVSEYSVLITKELGLDETVVNDIRIGSLLHDIGKIGIPDSILLKMAVLTKDEIEIMRKHPRTGVNILSQVRLLEPMLPAILEHHERLDGSGYPAHLTDNQITWMGRIVAVADVFDAMTSNRPYRQALSNQEVIAYLREKAGILFDAACVQALETILTNAS